MTVSPAVMVPVILSVLFSCLIFFFLYFCNVSRHWPLVLL